MKTLEGMTLEEIQEAIKETMDAYACEIYTIKHEQKHPLIGAIKRGDCWLPMSWDLNGRLYSINKVTAFDLKLPDDEIDWSAFPVDTLVNIPKLGARYLDGGAGYFAQGQDSETCDDFRGETPTNVELLEGRIMPWFGGDQPVPDNVEVRLISQNGSIISCHPASSVTWRKVYDFAAYQLTGRIL